MEGREFKNKQGKVAMAAKWINDAPAMWLKSDWGKLPWNSATDVSHWKLQAYKPWYKGNHYTELVKARNLSEMP